jgi:hypothetical protein
MFGGSTVWSSTLIRIMSSLFMAVPFPSNPSDALLPHNLGEPPPSAKITILKTIFSRSENQHSQVFRTDPSCSTQHRINGRITGP